MLHIKCFTCNPFQENTYLMYDDLGEAALVDPGCYTSEEKARLEAFIDEKGLKLKHLLNTHCHIDHVLGNAWAIQKYGLSLHIHAQEEAVLKAVQVYAPNYGFPAYTPSEPEGYLTEGQVIQIGRESIHVLFVPGHSPGHVVFYHPESGQCLAGDTLFYGSIGRTDLPGGNHSLLLEKITTQLFTLPDATVIFSGHGPKTSIGFEKKSNPFVGQTSIS
ncbi:MAG: MBL fold metallo-hydrolase [Algoriphagus sp.]